MGPFMFLVLSLVPPTLIGGGALPAGLSAGDHWGSKNHGIFKTSASWVGGGGG